MYIRGASTPSTRIEKEVESVCSTGGANGRRLGNLRVAFVVLHGSAVKLETKVFLLCYFWNGWWHGACGLFAADLLPPTKVDRNPSTIADIFDAGLQVVSPDF